MESKRPSQQGANNYNWKGGISRFKIKYKRRFQARYPEKAAAHRATYNAMRRGELVRQPCQVCGTTDRVEAHHEDYSKPLVVEWMCRPCHRTEHEARRPKRPRPRPRQPGDLSPATHAHFERLIAERAEARRRSSPGSRATPPTARAAPVACPRG